MFFLHLILSIHPAMKILPAVLPQRTVIMFPHLTDSILPLTDNEVNINHNSQSGQSGQSGQSVLPWVVEAGQPGGDVSVVGIAQSSPPEGASSPGENFSQFIHHGGVVGPGRKVADSHHLHQLRLLGLGVPLVHTSHLEGCRDPGVPEKS